VAFKTFNVGDVLTASDANTYLMKQAVIVCTSGTRPSSPVEGMTIYETDTDNMITYDGTGWRRYNARPLTATVATSEGTATTSYTDLATAGPTISAFTTGDSVRVTITANISNSGANASRMSVTISGATTLAADDTRALEVTGTSRMRCSMSMVLGITAGSNTFTAKYLAAAGTATFVNRVIEVEAV